MNPKNVTKYSMALFLTFCVSATVGAAEKPMNVLMLVADDLNTWLLENPQRYAGKVIAPNLTSLAESGVTFKYAPQKWFDLYPLDTLMLPKVSENDLSDLSQYGINLSRLHQVAPPYEWVQKNNEWKPLVQSYLACVSFVDHQIGKVLDALDASPYRDNSYVVLYTDHGFHLGEKERFAERSLWEDGMRVPMIIAGPGVAQGKVCTKPVQLLDIYPTLLEMAGLDADLRLEGHSMAPLLKNPNADWPYVARTSFGPGNVSIRSERYRYIHYNDGSEEFYDHSSDPHEWTNLITNPEVASHVKKHRMFLPETYAPLLGKGSTGHKAYTASEAQK